MFVQTIDIHAVAGLLKGYLRDIPECVFTTEGMDSLLKVHNNNVVEQKLKEFNRILYNLPPTNRECIKVLIKHLARVTQMEKQNKMSVENVAKIFGPTMMHYGKDIGRMANLKPNDILAQGQVVAFIIENFNRLFNITRT